MVLCSSSFSIFFSQILYLFLHVTGGGTFPRALSAAQEKRCLEEMAQGSQAARQKLIEHNLRLVAHIIKKYYARQDDQEDLISIGTIGLIKAIDSFDNSKGIRLSSYASRCIENEILMYLRKNQNQRGEISIDEPLNVDWDGNELMLSDILGTDPDIISRPIEQDAEQHMLLAAVDRLSERERKIMHLRFGLRGGNEHTQKEVADTIGISQSYISRLEKRIIKRLRREIEAVV